MGLGNPDTASETAAPATSVKVPQFALVRVSPLIGAVPLSSMLPVVPLVVLPTVGRTWIPDQVSVSFLLPWLVLDIVMVIVPAVTGSVTELPLVIPLILFEVVVSPFSVSLTG